MPVAESLFYKVTHLYLATLLKERTPIHVFSDEFLNFLQHTSRLPLLLYGKIFYK